MERSLEILRRIFVFGQPGEGFPLLVIPAVLIGLALQLFGARLFAAFVAVLFTVAFILVKRQSRRDRYLNNYDAEYL